MDTTHNSPQTIRSALANANIGILRQSLQVRNGAHRIGSKDGETHPRKVVPALGQTDDKSDKSAICFPGGRRVVQQPCHFFSYHRVAAASPMKKDWNSICSNPLHGGLNFGSFYGKTTTLIFHEAV